MAPPDVRDTSRGGKALLRKADRARVMRERRGGFDVSFRKPNRHISLRREEMGERDSASWENAVRARLGMGVGGEAHVCIFD